MSNYSSLIGGDSSANRLIDESRKAGAIFPEATWDQVGINKQLTDFLRNSIDPGGTKFDGDTEALKRFLIQDIEDARGNAFWLAAIDGPSRYPSGIHQHQFLNLLERLYLSSPSGYRKKPYYGDDLQSVEIRQQKLSASFAFGGVGGLLIGATIWMTKRRDSVSSLKKMSDLSNAGR